MQGRTKILIAGAAAVVALGTGTGIAIAGGGGGDDDEAPITGSALEQAKAAALAETGGGTVTETEVGDEESLYEVEVTLDDGTQVDVQLDENFNVVGRETDGAGEDEGPGDDR
ncbi:MAG: PepSY domain-containing protein [Actinomycetota bacterium]